MTTHDANVSLFYLEVKPLATDALQVVRLRGKERISHLFRFDLDLISQDPDIDFADVVNKPATLKMMRDDQEVKLFGIIADFQVGGKTADWVAYSAVFVPRIWVLTLNYQTRIFQNLTVEDIITQVLKEGGFTPKDFKFSLKGKYKPREYCVQYRETDLEFISRLMEYEGMYYYFEQGPSSETLVITDDKSSVAAIEGDSDLDYRTGGAMEPEKNEETVNEFVCRERIVTGKVVLKDYNYRTPQVNVQGDSQLNKDMPGTFYEYGEHVKDASEAKAMAKIRNEEIECGRRMFTGRSDCVGFRAGYKFTLEKHYRSGIDGDYLLMEVNHTGSQRGALPGSEDKGPTYSNEFVCVPADVQYRPPRVTPEPRLNGIMTAKVETAGGQYAYLDDEGRYRVKMPFDLSSAGSGKASRAIRMAQPYTGTNYGMHFPVLEGAEMVWACIDGNVDRPLGLATAPNPTEKSPVIAQNKSQNILRTAGGNELIMEDKVNDTFISMKTTDAHTLLLDDKDDKVEIVTTKKNLATMDDKNQNITVQTTDGHLLIMDDKNTKITVQSKNGHFITIDDAGGSESITLSDANKEVSLVIDIANKQVTVTSKSGGIAFSAPSGLLEIEATEMKVKTSGDISLEGANISMKAQSGITIDAMMDCKLHGLNIEAKADVNCTLEAGVALEAKGAATAKLEGGMAQVNGNMSTMITGPSVMIN